MARRQHAYFAAEDSRYSKSGTADHAAEVQSRYANSCAAEYAAEIQRLTAELERLRAPAKGST